jgi:two-component system response regulator YesN
VIQVLLVDDDRLARAGLRQLLPWADYGMLVVGEAANGQKALEFLEQCAADLVMVDLSMPVMDGMEMIRACKRLYPELAFAVMTFHEDFERVQEALRLGVLDYISKLKLESEDAGLVLRRIAERFREQASAKHARQLDESTCERFRHPLWLSDDLCMDQLERNILSSGYDIHDLAMLINESMVRIENAAGIKCLPLPSLDDAGAVVGFLKRYRKHAAAEAERGDSAEARVIHAAELINDNYTDAIKTADIASRVNLSRGYLSGCFKNLMGVTINEFLQRKRVREAMRLIKDGGVSIREAARVVGYENYKHFKDVFIEITGMSPGEYRRGGGIVR